jgi:2-octaprenyl-3-methyl-6-methoxy-1,4-benzoquinol hydroxylase/2-octaprenylphenol hydroxylase
MRASQYDVIIIGAGMVGSALGCLLSRSGFSVAVVEAREPVAFDPAQPVGLRVSAFSPGSANVLGQAGAWQTIETVRSCAYRRMMVEDRDKSSSLEFVAPAFGLERLGSIVENDLVQWTLWQLLGSSALVQRYCPEQLESIESDDATVSVTLASGTLLQAPLLVGADGAGSQVRAHTGISQEHWEYNQKAVVGVVRCERANPGIAWQRFMKGGPLAFLPLGDGASSIVWSRPLAEADRLLSLDDSGFLAELETACGAWLGSCETVGERAAFPLTMRLSERYVSRRIVLLGDAAHVVHPMAGQGVNLGIADAASLTELLIGSHRSGRDIGEPAMLQRFDRWRRSENEIMARGTHALRDLFSPDSLGLLRRIGMRAVSRSWLLREAFLRRATGRSSNSPRLCRGDSLASLLRG